MEGDDPCEIVPGLFLGSSKSVLCVEKLGITRVLNVAFEVIDHVPEHVEYLHVPMEDDEDVDVTSHMAQAMTFLSNKKGEVECVPTLVHCQAGRSRSVAVVMCHLIRHANMHAKEAFLEIKKKRSRAMPNRGLWSLVAKAESETWGQELQQPFDVDLYHTDLLVEMGWTNVEKVKEALKKGDGSIETAMYILMSSNK